jgi:hypothetical protein
VDNNELPNLIWEQFTSAQFLPSIFLHSFNLARKKR